MRDKEKDKLRAQTYRDKNRDEYNKNAREWRRENADRINTLTRARRKANPDKYRAQDKARYAKDPLGHKLQRYSITKEQYLQMEDSQNNKCAICDKEMKVINIDHCHETKKVRGLLCTACNTGIGKLKDDITILESAIKYLSAFK